MSRKRTILVSGMVAADPWQGGATWAVLQYVLGLRELAQEVYLVEPVPPKAVRPAGAALADSDNAKYFRQVVEQFDLAHHSALLNEAAKETYGLSYAALKNIAHRADLLINISGMLADEDLLKAIPVRVYLDLDPAFNQLWHSVQGLDRHFAGHTHFVTIGLRLGQADCPVPTCGLTWSTTLQPIVLSYWKPAERGNAHTYTTIANWRGYGSIEHAGVRYGQKAHSLREFLDLPGLSREDFVLALSIHPDETKDLAALAKHGWRLVDPLQVAHSPTAYQQFIQESQAEFGIAKSGYVLSRCGWFSDRSVCYLASGRPVIAQETGFSRHLPTGEGLFAFSSSDEFIRSAEAVRADSKKQATRARALAEEFFDSAKVLTNLLRALGA